MLNQVDFVHRTCSGFTVITEVDEDVAIVGSSLTERMVHQTENKTNHK